jgi:hypothetical protein
LHVTGWNDVWRRRLEGEVVDEPEEGDFSAPPEATARAWADARAAACTREAGRARGWLFDTDPTPASLAGLHGALPGMRSHPSHWYHSGQIGLPGSSAPDPVTAPGAASGEGPRRGPGRWRRRAEPSLGAAPRRPLRLSRRSPGQSSNARAEAPGRSATILRWRT